MSEEMRMVFVSYWFPPIILDSLTAVNLGFIFSPHLYFPNQDVGD